MSDIETYMLGRRTRQISFEEAPVHAATEDQFREIVEVLPKAETFSSTELSVSYLLRKFPRVVMWFLEQGFNIDAEKWKITGVITIWKDDTIVTCQRRCLAGYDEDEIFVSLTFVLPASVTLYQ